MPRLQPAPGYITSKEATELLRVSDGMLSQYVKMGKLKRYGPEERKQKFYKLSEVKALAATRHTFDEYQEKLPSFFVAATSRDIPAIADIDERTFNAGHKEREPRESYIHSIEETYLRWIRKTPEAFSVLRDTTNKVIGYAILLPLKKDTMDRFVRDEISMSDIPSSDIEVFEPGKPLHLYVIALCIDPKYQAQIKHAYGARLINGVFAFVLELAQRGVEIETITARNDYDKPDGRQLLQKMGMPQLHSSVPKKYLYSVRVADSGYHMLEQYCDTLTEWKRENTEGARK